MPAPGLPSPDSHHLNAALGWLELGNTEEAGREIARLAPEHLDHPDVLDARWRICAAGASWEAALDIANILADVASDRPSVWIQRAYSLRRVPGGGLERAWNALRPALDKFPRVAVIPYNLACYAAQFGRLAEAWEWLHKAMEAEGNVEGIKQMALADPDLEPLWGRIREL